MSNSKKLMFIFGTRPEAIKMAPIIKACQKRTFNQLKTSVVVTAQHRDMLDQILGLFRVVPDYDLNVMRRNQKLEQVTSRALKALCEILERESPDIVLVQGDTTTTFVGALAAYYKKIPVGHVEAGLRSYDKAQPYPEEVNRRLTTVVTDIHFAPTKKAAQNLYAEGISQDTVLVTGNTVIDALLDIAGRESVLPKALEQILSNGNRIILVTAHRRENFGKPLEDICGALREIALAEKDIEIAFPVHPNPHVRKTVRNILGSTKRIHLFDPLGYEEFVHLMARSYLILTDSGGVQEEAPSLGKPVLVLREKTERREAVEAGVAKLVGVNKGNIVRETIRLLHDHSEYRCMTGQKNPYGDGKASQRILDAVCGYLRL